jgi:hypothetical protein
MFAWRPGQGCLREFNISPRTQRDHRTPFYKIPADDWKLVDWNDSFWKTGILTYRRRKYGRSEFETVRHFNVRFDPDAVAAIVAPHSSTAAGSSMAAEPEARRLAVPPAYLAAWFEFYRKIGGDMREEAAHAHAKMCFPKNSVSRQKIRDLLPDRPMGRPKKNGT